MPDNVFSALADAFYTPKVNAVGVDANGNFVDATGKPTTLYSQPGLFERALNPEAQEVQLMNAQASADAIRQQQQKVIARQQAGQDIATLPFQDNPNLGAFGQPQLPTSTQNGFAATNPSNTSLISPMGMSTTALPPAAPTDYHSFTSGAPSISNVGNTNLTNRENQAWITQSLHPELTSSELAPQVRNQSMINTGLIAHSAANDAAANFATSDYQRQLAQGQQRNAPVDVATQQQEAQNRLTQAGQLTPLQNSIAMQQFRALYGREPILESIADQQALTQLATTGQEARDVPITTGTQHNERLWENLASQYRPDELVSAPFLNRIGPNNTIQTSGGQFSPLYRPAAMTMMQAIQRGYMNGEQGQPMQVKGVDRGVIYNPPPPLISPIYGSAYQGDSGSMIPVPTIPQSANSYQQDTTPTVAQQPASQSPPPASQYPPMRYSRVGNRLIPIQPTEHTTQGRRLVNGRWLLNPAVTTYSYP